MIPGKNILIIAGGMLLGIILCLVFKSCDDTDSQYPQADIIRPSVIANNAEKQEMYFKAKIDSLQEKTKTLNESLKSTNELLSRSKQKNGVIQKELLALGNKDSALYTTDESLKTTLAVWIQAGNEKDSLYDVVIDNQVDQLQAKDSVIMLQQQQYRSLQVNFNESLTQGNLLIKQNAYLQKNIKRRKLQTKLLSGLTAIVTGFAVSYILKH